VPATAVILERQAFSSKKRCKGCVEVKKNLKRKDLEKKEKNRK